VVRGEEQGSWPRQAVSFEQGSERLDGTLHLNGEQVKVCRPNMDSDPETEALIELLS